MDFPTDVLVTLSQPDHRMSRDDTGRPIQDWFERQVSMGLVIYRTDNGKPKKRLKRKYLVDQSRAFTTDREVTIPGPEWTVYPKANVQVSTLNRKWLCTTWLKST